MILARHPVLANAGGLVQQVEAEDLVGYPLVAPGEGLPEEYKGILGDRVEPQIVALQVVAVDAVARGAMEIQAHLKRTGAAGLEVAVEIVEDSLVGMEVVEVARPEAVVGGYTDKVELEPCQEIQCSLVGRFRRSSLLPDEHPQEVETVTRYWCRWHKPPPPSSYVMPVRLLSLVTSSSTLVTCVVRRS